MPTPEFVTDERAFNLALLKALGLDHLPVQKVVLVAEAGCLPQVYVKCLTPSAISDYLAGRDLAQVPSRQIEDVSVSDMGEVSVVEGGPVKANVGPRETTTFHNRKFRTFEPPQETARE